MTVIYFREWPARQSDALQRALDRIEREFSASAEIADFKHRVRSIIHDGTGNPALRARYSIRLQELLGYSIDAACFTVDRWYRDHLAELKRWREVPYAPQPPRITYEILRELRLILRLIRRSKFRGEFQVILWLVLGREATRQHLND
jgi:hypothetical protein